MATYGPPAPTAGPRQSAADLLNTLVDHLSSGDMTDDDLATWEEFYGGAAPQQLPPEPELPQQSMAQNILGSLAGIDTQGLPAPRGFGQSLVAGLTHGLGDAGTRIQQQRARLEAARLQRQAKRDEANAKATEDYRSTRSKGRAKLVEDAIEARRKANAPETPVAVQGPNGPVFVSRSDAIGKSPPTKEESPAEKRAADAAARAAEAAERANRLAQTQTVGKLFDDYRVDPAIKGYQGVRSNLNTAEEAAKQRSGPGDIGLVFAFMRALEPENPNAVREGEYSNARQATGLLQQVKNLPARYFQGNQLTESGRQFFLSAMRAQLKSRRADYDLANDQYKRRAKEGGVDASLFIREFPEAQPAAGAESGYRPRSWRPTN